ncbi:MAG: DUF1674 domain-containing protein [Alphaproteobacteria bacterium]|nr:DUF1674 domain-containing protein [Alphaproteobacteria bacterium]
MTEPPSPKEPVPRPVPETPVKPPVPEVGGVAGPDPTRYGDWQHRGRVSDF